MIRGALAVYGPQIADAAEIEFRVGLRGKLQHTAMPDGAMAAADLADLYPIVCADIRL